MDQSVQADKNVYAYRVVAKNTVGYGAEFPSLTAQSISDPVAVLMAPSGLSAVLQAGPQVRLTWTDNSTNEAGFSVQRSTDGVKFSQMSWLRPTTTSAS